MRKVYGAVAVIAILALIIGVATVFLLNSAPENVSQTPTPTLTQSPSQTPTTSSTTPMPTPSPSATQTTDPDVPTYSYTIVHTYPHDSSAFTEGLIQEDGTLLESTGLNGASSLRLVNLTDGSILQRYNLPYEYFGEGIAVVNDKIVQLTWQNKIGFVYDKETFELLGNFSINTEGWGLTYDGNRLIMSDGTSTLYFLDPNTYEVTGSINVQDNKGPVDSLNELEYINGTIYANIWFSPKIAVINPTSGQVQAYIDLTETAQLYTTSNPNAVLNGIAYNSQTNQLFVTGKYWPYLYEIEIQK